MAEAASPPSAPPPVAWWQNEDWLAGFTAVPLLVAVVLGWSPTFPALGWSAAADLGTVFSAANLGATLGLGGLFVGLGTLGLLPVVGRGALRFAAGAAVVFTLAWAGQLVAAQASVKAYGLEYVLFALGFGLVWNHTLPVPAWVREAARTEFFIKTGIVLLGATILLPDLLKAGLPGLLQAALVIPAVWYACFFLARRLRVDDEFAVMLSTAVSICGVAAAIAACGAIQGDRKKLSYVTSVVLLCAVPMMIGMPWLVHTLGLSEAVGGAWIGGTLDTSGSVAAATELVGKEATRVGVIVKLSQNVLIGIAAFAISVWWSLRGGGAGGEGKGASAAVI